jgi:hypothetical protein
MQAQQYDSRAHMRDSLSKRLIPCKSDEIYLVHNDERHYTKASRRYPDTGFQTIARAFNYRSLTSGYFLYRLLVWRLVDNAAFFVRLAERRLDRSELWHHDVGHQLRFSNRHRVILLAATKQTAISRTLHRTQRRRVTTNRYKALSYITFTSSRYISGFVIIPPINGFGLEGPLSLSPANGFGVVGSYYWLSPLNYDKLLPFYPLIVVLCASVLLFFVYRSQPERVQRTLPWLLFIPILLSSVTVLIETCYNCLDWYEAVSNAAAPHLGSVGFMANVVLFSYYTLFWHLSLYFSTSPIVSTLNVESLTHS